MWYLEFREYIYKGAGGTNTMESLGIEPIAEMEQAKTAALELIKRLQKENWTGYIQRPVLSWRQNLTAE